MGQKTFKALSIIGIILWHDMRLMIKSPLLEYANNYTPRLFLQ